jgi:hypothetical protein
MTTQSPNGLFLRFYRCVVFNAVQQIVDYCCKESNGAAVLLCISPVGIPNGF